MCNLNLSQVKSHRESITWNRPYHAEQSSHGETIWPRIEIQGGCQNAPATTLRKAKLLKVDHGMKNTSGEAPWQELCINAS